MGNIQSISKLSFQDMNYCIHNNYAIITVLKDDSCLIKGTISIHKEEDTINHLYNNDIHKPIVIYGYNSCDENIFKKYQQLKNLGFHKVYIYPGGMFEWLMLQDIYTDKYFKTTSKELNVLKYKPQNVFD